MIEHPLRAVCFMSLAEAKLVLFYRTEKRSAPCDTERLELTIVLAKAT